RHFESRIGLHVALETLEAQFEMLTMAVRQRLNGGIGRRIEYLRQALGPDEQRRREDEGGGDQQRTVAGATHSHRVTILGNVPRDQTSTRETGSDPMMFRIR